MRSKEAQVSENDFRHLTSTYLVNVFSITSADAFKQNLLDIPEDYRTEWLLDFIDSDMPSVSRGTCSNIALNISLSSFSDQFGS